MKSRLRLLKDRPPNRPRLCPDTSSPTAVPDDPVPLPNGLNDRLEQYSEGHAGCGHFGRRFVPACFATPARHLTTSLARPGSGESPSLRLQPPCVCRTPGISCEAVPASDPASAG